MDKKWFETNGGKVIEWLKDNGKGSVKQIAFDTGMKESQVNNEFKALKGVKNFGQRILFDEETKQYYFDDNTMKLPAYEIWKEMKRHYRVYGSDAKFYTINPKDLESI